MDDKTEVLSAGDRAARSADPFTPGTLVAGRYRIVALLGEGGMGEVYRADDVKLGHRVALKYLPARIGDDAEAIERFYSEVRIGRQLAHPNVCRVYDIVESDGHRFIAMEYVDGEDLRSLLRRIGRLPPDTALRIARDICFGLAAAHERGYIHRDLKPANIMIDASGTARITDFGLAVLAGEAGHEVAGTPAYMAPEQLAGGMATARSDVYALGLVLFEMFTGHCVFDSEPIAILREHHSSPKLLPSAIVRDIDPVVEQLILRCINEDPHARPGSARQVAAALPGGGDPLDAAVAAGETPSPQMVIAANRAGDLTQRRAWAFLGTFLFLLVLMTLTRERAMLTWFAPDVKPRETLVDRARSVERALGYTERARDSSTSYATDYALLQAAVEDEGPGALRTAADWMRLFHYRDSPERLIPQNANGRILPNDPPFSLPGMTLVTLHASGRLREFRRIPPATSDGSTGSPDWSSAFREAQLDPSRFRPVTPRAVPPVGADRRYAWEGNDDGRIIHVDAASLGGRPVWFSVRAPWSSAGDFVQASPTSSGAALTYLVTIVAGIILGRHNIVRRRADLKGANRLAMAAGIVELGALLCGADHTADIKEEWRMIAGLLGTALYFAFVIWLCHLAIEPYVRRRWPHMLVSAKRLMAGRWRDPLVGSDILRGLIAALIGIILWTVAEALLTPRGLYLPRDHTLSAFATRPAGMIFLLFNGIARGVFVSFVFLMVVVVARLAVSRDAAAWAITWLLASLNADDLGGSFIVDFLVRAALFAPVFIAAWRHGTLALMTAMSAMLCLVYLPMTSDMTQWYGRFSAVVVLVVALIGVYAFHISLGGKPMLGRFLLEDDEAAV